MRVQEGCIDSHDTATWLPEADPVLGTGSCQEVVDLLVDVDSAGEILLSSNLSLDEMVAVDGSGNSGLRQTSRHELEDSHLRGISS